MKFILPTFSQKRRFVVLAETVNAAYIHVNAVKHIHIRTGV